jgi:hypothetical protein
LLHIFQGSFSQFEQIFPDLVCNYLWQAALRRIELFGIGRAIFFKSGET